MPSRRIVHVSARPWPWVEASRSPSTRSPAPHPPPRLMPLRRANPPHPSYLLHPSQLLSPDQSGSTSAARIVTAAMSQRRSALRGRARGCHGCGSSRSAEATLHLSLQAGERSQSSNDAIKRSSPPTTHGAGVSSGRTAGRRASRSRWEETAREPPRPTTRDASTPSAPKASCVTRCGHRHARVAAEHPGRESGAESHVGHVSLAPHR